MIGMLSIKKILLRKTTEVNSQEVRKAENLEQECIEWWLVSGFVTLSVQQVQIHK